MARIRSVSVSEEDDLLINQLNLSPTSLIREQISRIKLRNQGEIAPDMADFQQKIELLSKKINKLYQYIESKGLTDDVLAYESR